MIANVEIHRVCQFVRDVLYSYRRGLRSCLSLQGGKFEGQEREISSEYGSHAFYIGSCGKSRAITPL